MKNIILNNRIDIHSYINKKEDITLILEDMKKYNINFRLLTKNDENYCNLENLIQNLEFIKKYNNLFACCYLNPKDFTCFETLNLALQNNKVKAFELNSFLDGYFPELNKKIDKIFKTISDFNNSHKETEHKIIKLFTGIGARSIPQQWEFYIKKYKNVNFILLHLGCFDYGYTCIDVISRNNNCYGEISNQYEIQILKKAINNLAENKLIFGTFYPKRLTISTLNLFETINITNELKYKIYNENANHLIRF